MSKAPKQKTKARAPKGRERVIVEGKVMYVNARGARILRAARKAFKGLEV